MKTISLEQNLTAALNSVEAERLLIDQSYDYKSVFVNKVKPDSTNPRFFPAILIEDLHAYQVRERKLSKQQIMKLYDARDKVLIGKGCIVNCFKNGSNEWKKANQSIESIIELAENVAVSEIIQVPTIFPTEDGDYQILTGHRRFFALVYVNGVDSAAHFKVYDSCPLLPKTKQFQENASREDLPQYGKLMAFKDALLEIEILNNTRIRVGNKALTVRETAGTLGISMGAYDNYNVLTRYQAVMDAYSNGYSQAFVQMKKTILKIEAQYKRKIDKNVLNTADRKVVNERLVSFFNGEKLPSEPKPEKTTFQVNKLGSVDAIKTLLTTNVMELDTGIDWQKVDWQDKKGVDKALNQLVEFLNDQQN